MDLHSPSLASIVDLSIENVERLISDGADVNSCDVFGTTILLRAIEVQNARLVEFLLNRGANPNQGRGTSDYGRPLLTAVQSASCEITESLLNHGASLQVIMDNPECLVSLLKMGETFIIRRLVDLGLDVNIQSQKLWLSGSLLISAIIYGHDDLVPFLINNTLDVDVVDFYERTAFHYGVLRGNVNGVKLLIERGAAINTSDISNECPMKIAVEENKFEIAKYLVDTHAKLDHIQDKSMNNIVQLAVRTGNIEFVKLVVEAGADIKHKNIRKQSIVDTCLACVEMRIFDSRVCTDLISYLQTKNFDFKLMLDHPHIPENFYTYGDVTLLKLLMANKLRIKNDAKHADFLPPLHAASMNQNYGLLYNLHKEHKINLALLDNKGNSILGRVTRTHSFLRIKELIKLGLDPDVVNNEGACILQLSIKHDNPERCFKYLLNQVSSNSVVQTLRYCIDSNKVNHVEWLVMHIALQTHAETDSSYQTFHFEKQPQYVQDHFHECKLEIKKSKCYRIAGIVFFKVLKMHKRSILGKNTILRKKLEHGASYKEFPIYSEVALFRANKSFQFHDLLDKAIIHFGSKLDIRIGSNKIVLELIFQYLSTNDLMSMLKI